MTTTQKPLAIHKAVSTLVRPKFGPGMLLEHGDLELLPAYTRELNRMMFRSLFGCGVVCGLRVDANEHCGKVRITVDCGLAIDCEGDPVYVPKQQTFDLDGECDTKVVGPLWIVLCGTSKCCAPRTSMCATDDDEAPPVCTRERDAFEIRVLAASMGCGCAPADAKLLAARRDTACKCVDPALECYADHYAGKCGCGCKEGDCECCDCDCIVLARVDATDDPVKPWKADHSVRRFVRPVLMRDPLVEEEEKNQLAQAQIAPPAVVKKASRARRTVARASPPPKS